MLVLTIFVVLAVLAAAAFVDLARERRASSEFVTAVTPRIERALRDDPNTALDGLGAIASAKLHAADGKVIAETPASPPTPSSFAATVASRVAPAEIVCSDTTSGDTLCIEQSPAPLVARTAFWLRTISFGALAALLLGLVGALLTRRAIVRRLTPVGAALERVVRERDYSQRIPASAGALGVLATSANAMVDQMQQRELALTRRIADLEASNKELEAFAHAISHDLRGPLGSVEGFAQALQQDFGDGLSATGSECVEWIREGCERMRELVDGLLEMTRVVRGEMEHDDVDLSALAGTIAEALRQSQPQRNVDFRIAGGARTTGDPRLLRVVLENLLANAFKFTRQRDPAVIEFGVTRNGGAPAFYVRDNGAGFDASHAAKMFRPFQRLHSAREFEGTGIGLATVQKIVNRHGGKAWAEGEVGKGATIYFTTGVDAAARA